MKLEFKLVLISLVFISFSYIIFLLSPQEIKYQKSENLFAFASEALENNTGIQNKGNQNFKVTFVGDMMFDRAVRKTVNQNGYDYVFGDSKKIFSGSDLVIGNLEGPITPYPSRTLLSDGSMPDILSFTFPPETALALKDQGIGIVSLANNHEANFGREGILSTKEYLRNAGVSYFGDPNNFEEIETTTCKNSICIGLIGFHEFSYQNQEKIINKIHELRSQVNYIIIFPHWGDEYNTDFTSSQRILAHRWIDEGADLVIGAHPHVIEPIETYKDKTIFYSLGNYIFDQYFSFNTTHGLVVKLNFSQNGYTYDLQPVDNTGIQVKIPDEFTSEKVLGGINRIP